MAGETISPTPPAPTINISIHDFLQLKQQLNDLISRQSSSSLAKTKVIIDKDPRKEFGGKVKPTNLPEFYGSRTRYPAWRTAVLDTFRVDWNEFGYDNSRAFLIIYNSLKGGALEKAGPFYEAGGVNRTRDPEDFIEFLDRIYFDATRVSQANLDLHAMKMRENENWADFFAAWSNKLTEARGDFWPDENKISMLQNSINKKLTRALVGNHLLPDNDFREWISIVNKVAQQVERAEKKSVWVMGQGGPGFGTSPGVKDSATGSSLKEPSHRYQMPEASRKPALEFDQDTAVDESGDVIMGGINSAKVAGKFQGRANWKSRAQLERLKEEGKCYRCERKGCFSRTCPLLPARKPNGTGPRINSIELPEIDPSIFFPLGEAEPTPEMSEN
ncbi:hypothetical protein K3495_g13394 [Podosphaera aphanis]|nr:hypothetical protein K3495_g13394 [Podosphaera aphanis]